MVLFFKEEGVGTVAGFVVVAAEVVVDDPPATAVLLPDMVGCVVNVGAAVVDVVVLKPGAPVAVDDAAAPDDAGVDVLPKPVKLKLGADVVVAAAEVVAVEGVDVVLLAEGIVKPKPPVAGLAAVVEEAAAPAAGAPKPPKPPVVDVDGVVEVVENNGAAPVLEGAAVDVAIDKTMNTMFIVNPHLYKHTYMYQIHQRKESMMLQSK